MASSKVPGFVHLHNHSTYSLLDGAQKLHEMCARAAGDGQPAIAVTDHGNLFGAMDFGKKADKNGIKPIIGIEAYVAPGARTDRTPPRGGRKPYHHLTLLAQNYTGYKNLIRLATAGYLEGFYYRPRIDKELLERYGEGLACLSGCLAGEIPSLLLQERMEEAERTAAWFRELFGKDRYWLELQDHGIEEQTRVNEGLVRLSKEFDLGLVATNDCHYLLPDDHFAHEVLVCIQTGRTIESRGSMTYSPQHYLKTREEMARLFAWAPEAVENTLAVAESCRFAFEKQSNHLPDFPVPEGYDLEGYFEKVVRDGFERRLASWKTENEGGRLRHSLQDYRDRLEQEIKIIREMGFAGYFLIVWDFIRYAREQDIPVGPGRGSAAGSLVAFCMRITDIDPMQYDLLFERFLNPERVSLPDIDIDFCFRKRGDVIEYVTEKYGRPNVAQIITFGSMAARAVIRDVGRGLEIPYAEVDRIAKMVPAQPGVDVTIEESLRTVPALKTAYDTDDKVRQLLDVGQRLEGLFRHASTHAAGVVIAPKPIVEFAPLYKGTKDGDEVTTQWAKDEIEEIGLLKMDFLGLKTLTIIDDAINSVRQATSETVDLDALPLDDDRVYDLFRHASTDGIFQFESEGMKDILRRMKPNRFEDLVALNALYRPGPIGGGLIDDFIKRRHGKIRVEYPHPLTEEILQETYGVIVYQEQVMQIASRMAGYTLGEADILRRAMGKKKKEVMEAESKKFIQGAKRRGVHEREARKVFELMAFFAGYGFNKSHSAAYALVAYQTAWLKVHHPVHFMAAVLTIEKGNTDKLVKHINSSREMGIEVLPPDVNTSGMDFTVEGDSIRFGLSAIKGVGEGAIRSVLEARDRVGAFTSLHAMCGELDLKPVNKRVVEALVNAGALDCLGGRRSQLAASVDAAMEYGQKRQADREAGQTSLFDSPGSPAAETLPEPSLPDLPEWDERTRLANEKATLGFYISGHPLESHRDLVRDYATHSTGALRESESGIEVAVAGIIGDLRRRKSRKGEWWASMVLEDMEGQVEVLVFPKAYAVCETILENERPVLATGRLEIDEERLRVLVEDVCPLEEVVEKKSEAVQIRVNASQLDDDLVRKLRKVMESHPGNAQVYLEVTNPGSFRLMAKAESRIAVKPGPELTRELDELIGPARVRLRARSRFG